MGQIYEAMIQYLTEKKYHFQRHDDEETLLLSIAGRNGKWRVRVRTRQKRGQIIILTQVQANCPIERRPAMCEFLTRANYGLILGVLIWTWRMGRSNTGPV